MISYARPPTRIRARAPAIRVGRNRVVGRSAFMSSGLEPFLQIISQAVDDRIGLGLGEDLLDDGLDPARAPLAALAEVGLGALADHVRGGRACGRLAQADGAVAEGCQ